jgi:hypothetical protein
MRLTLCAGLTCVFGLAFAPAATAQKCQAPPGTSGIDQYCESIPGTSGDRGTGDRPDSGPPIPRSTRAVLERRGAAGRGILSLPAEEGTSDRSAAGSRRLTGGREARRTTEASEPSNDPFAALASGLESGSSVAGFVWLLITLAVLLSALALARVRGLRRDDAP